MKKIWLLILFIFMNICICDLYAGTFSVGIYGNTEGNYEDQTESTVSVTTNADWQLRNIKSYYELQFSGVNVGGFSIWSKVGASVEFYDSALKGNYSSSYFNQTNGVLPALISSRGENYKLRLSELNISKSIDLLDGVTKFTFFRGEDKTDVGQPYLDFFEGRGSGETRAGIQWDSYGLAGFYTKGFLNDYRTTYEDETYDLTDRQAYSLAGRIGRDLIQKDFLNMSFGMTGGAVKYYKDQTFEGVYVSEESAENTMLYYHNVLGADVTLNGDIPVIGSYYFFGGIGRTYNPENYPYEYRSGIAWLGNTNALTYEVEFKYNKKFETDDLQFGQVFLSFNVGGTQPRYQNYLGSSDNDKYYEKISLDYQFPYKAISMNGNIEYSHDYNFENEYFHMWNLQDDLDSSVALKKHLDMKVLFQSGFSFSVAWDNDRGKNYLGKFINEGIDYLTIATEGETEFGEISPQVKIVALGDENKQLISSGISILLNLSTWMKFYSRFAYVQSKGYWDSEGDLNWWSAFVQFQFYSGDNSKFFLEIGDGGQTDNGFVSDSDLIKGANFNKKVYLKFEYWS